MPATIVRRYLLLGERPRISFWAKVAEFIF
jgi:hypothetical protein